jgi:hypothetical protein
MHETTSGSSIGLLWSNCGGLRGKTFRAVINLAARAGVRPLRGESPYLLCIE